MSIAYLNNTSVIENFLEIINKHIDKLRNKIKRYMETKDIYGKDPNNPIQQLCKIRTLGKTALKNKIKLLMEHNTDNKIWKMDEGEAVKLLQFIPTTYLEMNITPKVHQKIRFARVVLKSSIKDTN